MFSVQLLCLCYELLEIERNEIESQKMARFEAYEI